MNRPESYETQENDAVDTDAGEYKELYLRTLADFDNYRKRVERDRAEIGAAGKRDLLLAIVDVVDNFELAVDSAADLDGDCGGLAAGVAAIYRQVRRLLETNGVERFESVGERFDPERHEALGLIPSADVPADAVVEEARSGYTWNGKLLRPARVFVSTGPGQ
jgi:molecular chaperone GrpE